MGRYTKETLPELAVKVAEASQGAVEKRLGRIYDEIIIDEVQDISRKSLDIIERLLSQATPHLMLVGDVRQSLLDSDQTSSKNRNADRLGLINWYRKHESAGLLEIAELCETWRSNQRIADFSDRIFPTELGFAPTNSQNQTVTGHDGVFLVHERHLATYLENYHPMPLRSSKASGKAPYCIGIQKHRNSQGTHLRTGDHRSDQSHAQTDCRRHAIGRQERLPFLRWHHKSKSISRDNCQRQNPDAKASRKPIHSY